MRAVLPTAMEAYLANPRGLNLLVEDDDLSAAARLPLSAPAKRVHEVDHIR